MDCVADTVGAVDSIVAAVAAVEPFDEEPQQGKHQERHHDYYTHTRMVVVEVDDCCIHRWQGVVEVAAHRTHSLREGEHNHQNSYLEGDIREEALLFADRMIHDN